MQPSAYKRCEKRWRRADAAAALASDALLDTRALAAAEAQELRRVGVRRAGTWRARGASGERPVLAFDGVDERVHGGFFVIPGALGVAEQLQLALACLAEYAEEPHRTNLHLHGAQVARIWAKAREFDAREPAKAPELGKLRWAASGFHYEWTERKYFKDDYSPVPEQLQELGAMCAEACGMTLDAEAVIVNYYKPNSTMGGHQDDVEMTMDHPVVSISLGSDCVFLKGGLTKDDPPLEVLLRSGDIAVFGGNSRLSYHGVACVIPTPFDVSDQQWAELEREALKAEQDVDELLAVRSYLSSQRININIRQVFPRENSEPQGS